MIRFAEETKKRHRTLGREDDEEEGAGEGAAAEGPAISSSS